MALKGVFSRSSSRTSLSSQPEDIRAVKEMIDTVEADTSQEPVTFMFDNTNDYDNEQLLATANDPLGSLILNISQTLNGLLLESKNKKTPKIDIGDLCQLYTEKMKRDTQKGEDQIEKTAKLAESNMLEASMNYHLITPKIQAPTYFSEVPTLNSVSKYKDALAVFGRNKYENNRVSPSVVEYLKLLNNSQAICKLSRAEFEQMMLRSTTGAAHKHIASFVQAGEDVETIYLKLLTLYDHSRTPEQCRDILNNLKAKKTDTLQTLCARILELSTEASRLAGQGEHLQQVIDLNATQALISALPNPPILGSPRRRVSQIFHELAARKGKLPTFTNLINRLSIYADEISDSIKLYGENVSKAFMPKGRQGSYNRTAMMEDNRGARGGYARINNLNQYGGNQGNNYANSGARPKYNGPRQTNGRGGNQGQGASAAMGAQGKFCSLCRSTNHNSFDLCYKIKHNGRPILVQPTQSPCTICLAKTGLNYYHPQRFCFNKDGASGGTPQKNSSQQRPSGNTRSTNGNGRFNKNIKHHRQGGN